MKKPNLIVTIASDEEGENESLTVFLCTKKCGEVLIWRDVTSISDAELVDLKKSIKFAKDLGLELKIPVYVTENVTDHINELENPSALAGT